MGAGPSNMHQNGGLLNGPLQPSTQRSMSNRPPEDHGFDEYGNEDFQGGQYRNVGSNYGY